MLPDQSPGIPAIPHGRRPNWDSVPAATAMRRTIVKMLVRYLRLLKESMRCGIISRQQLNWRRSLDDTKPARLLEYYRGLDSDHGLCAHLIFTARPGARCTRTGCRRGAGTGPGWPAWTGASRNRNRLVGVS